MTDRLAEIKRSCRNGWLLTHGDGLWLIQEVERLRKENAQFEQGAENKADHISAAGEGDSVLAASPSQRPRGLRGGVPRSEWNALLETLSAKDRTIETLRSLIPGPSPLDEQGQPQ